MSSGGETLQALVVTAPPQLRGETFSIEKDELTIGRAEDNDVRLEDPYVSRRHAVIRRRQGTLVIEDAGSTSGLIVNGVPAAEPSQLRCGDRIQVGDVELELVGGSAPADGFGEETRVRPPSGARPRLIVLPDLDDSTPTAPRTVSGGAPAAPAEPAAPIAQPRVTFEVPSQRGSTISNVGGNQVNSTYTENRYGVEALRLEPMRRRARWVMRLGFTLVLVGLATFGVGAAIYSQSIQGLQSCAENGGNGSSCLHFAGFDIVGVGSFLFAAGWITVIISLFMRREVRRQEARL